MKILNISILFLLIIFIFLANIINKFSIYAQVNFLQDHFF